MKRSRSDPLQAAWDAGSHGDPPQRSRTGKVDVPETATRDEVIHLAAPHARHEGRCRG